MAGFSSRGRHREINAWPGWVDALSSLVMVVVFLLMVFVVGQVFTAATLSRRDEQLTQLSGKVGELNDMLALERRAGEELRHGKTLLAGQLQAAVGRVADLEQTVAADRATIELRLREIASLQADLAALRTARDKLEGDLAALVLARDALAQAQQALAAANEGQAAKIAALEGQTKLSEAEKQRLLAEIGGLRDRSQALSAELADAREKTVLAQRNIDEREIKLQELTVLVATARDSLTDARSALTDERQAAGQGRLQVNLLNQQIAALREQLARVAAALDVSEKRADEQRVQIVDLGSRLNQALASKVQELARYRSEFFGRVREALGNRPDVRIVGDRFVFQSELLFPSGAAVLEPGGRERLGALARTLTDIAGQIPADINWVLRVDGHTDARPINTREFPSNWELSAARAISVVKFLIEQGIPAERLAAAGFGEHQPLDPARSDEALARNRRIELKLDQR